MIPDFTGSGLVDYVEYLTQILRNIEVLSQTHTKWYTHKNPHGCWICDLISLANKTIDLYYPSPRLDAMNSQTGNEIDIKR